jgi:iron complex outermembrane recepter protein
MKVSFPASPLAPGGSGPRGLVLRASMLSLLCSLPLAQGASTPDASAEELEAQRLKNLSIEELMDLEVTIATRSESSLSSTPGAVYVLTGDEIRRAGHGSIQEALRMVPGFYVSHWTSQAWDVTARGFGPGLSLTSSAFLNQLLVMIDGVVVYTPLYAGVWWALQDIDLADVDRIEIIRGPGGSLWGTNATHGVVHVITKSAADTQGARLSVRHGGYDQHAGARYGGRFGESGTYRVWAKGAWYGTLENAQLDFSNDWKVLSTGFRSDWQYGGKQFTFNARLYENTNDAYGFDGSLGTIPVVDRKKGYQLYASMVDPEQNSRLQAWFSTDQQAQPTFVDFTIDTFDLEYQRELALSATNRLTLGAGYRIVRSELRGDDPFFLDFDPHTFHQDVYRAYALDRIAFPSVSGELTLGLSLEHNDYTEFEVQPTARYTWNANEDLMLWGAVSRAVRTPSLEEASLGADSFYVGDPDFRSEALMAYELGARALLSSKASADLALFFNDYDDLHFEDPEGAQYVLTNAADGTAFGGELAVDVRPLERWTLRSAYSYLHGDYQNKVDGNDLGNEEYYPEHQFNLRSYYDLGADWELDSAVYMVEKMGPAYDIAEYWRVDARIGWRPTPAFDFYVGVQQLNDEEHSEYSSFNRVERTAFIGLNWHPGATAEPE